MWGCDLTVIKLGGSHAFADHLTNWIDAIAKQSGHVVVVAGGGPFADMVRAAQPIIGFDNRAAHRMALLAMEQFGCALASRSRKFAVADSRAAIGRLLRVKRIPVWLPSRMVLAARDIPFSWDVTSDSLAAWLAGRIGAGRLLLVKHAGIEGNSVGVDELVTRGIVDKAFPRFLKASGVAAFVFAPKDYVALGEAIRGKPAGPRIDPC